MTWPRLTAFLRSVPSRLFGSHVNRSRYHATNLSSWAHFPECERLAARRVAQRELIGDREVVADRILLEPQPDFGEPRGLLSDWPRDGTGSPIDFDNDGLPNG